MKELHLEKLIGSLMTYEMEIARQEKEMQEEEGANMCFMAFEDQDEVNSNSDDGEFMFEYNELLKAIYKFDEKNISLKKKVLELKKKLDEVKENFSKVEAPKIFLKKENEELLKKKKRMVGFFTFKILLWTKGF